MADDSPGKVQALRAIFAEKNKPVMGLIPPGGKMSTRPWKQSADSEKDAANIKERLNEQKVSSQVMTKVLPFPDKNSAVLNGKMHKASTAERSLRLTLKPVIGPKPISLPQERTSSSLNLTLESLDSSRTTKSNEIIRGRTYGDSQDVHKSHSRSKAFGETIASFMFTSELNNKENDQICADTGSENTIQPPLPKPRNSQTQKTVQNQTELMNFCNLQNKMLSKCDLETSCCNIISSDNYVCKRKCNFRRRELPSIEKLGPPPLKPLKPPHLKLLTKYSASQSNSPTLPERTQQESSAPQLPQKPQKPSYPCPPRPHTPPPLPPISAPVINPPNASLREVIEELYEDTLLEENRKRPVSLIPEYTEEEEQAEELYNDAGEINEVPMISNSADHMKLKNSALLFPSEYLQPNVNDSNEEIYQDAEQAFTEEYYEEMPCDTNNQEDLESPLYSNNRKEIEKLRKEEEKRQRKEQKEKEKREKEMEKFRKKFALTGEEIPIDDGLVKADSRGGKGDLPVKKGETVLILRMEGNPSGRWLVKNEKGKIGYVELTNIEVDPLSVKSASTTTEDGVSTTPTEKNITWLSKITACVR